VGYFYLGLALLGAVAPWSFLGQFLAVQGPDFQAMKAQATASPVAAYFAVNMLVSALVTVAFIAGEGRRMRMKGLWLPVAATFAIGVSCGLPLFLYLRKVSGAQAEAEAQAQAQAPPPPETARKGGR
jgi:hypothetical protein